MEIITGIIAVFLMLIISSALLSIPGAIIGGILSSSPKEGWESFKRQTTGRVGLFIYCIFYGALMLGAFILISTIFGGNP